MVKTKIIIFILFLLLASCTSKNEFGRSRVNINKFNFRPIMDKNIFSKIDSCAFYKLLLNDKLVESRRNRAVDVDMIEGFKFYNNGKVGYFKNVILQDVTTFNPKKSIMGIYKNTSNGINIEYIVKNPQIGIHIWKENIINIFQYGDTIKTFVVNNGDTVSYKKIKIPKEFLIYKPDW